MAVAVKAKTNGNSEAAIGECEILSLSKLAFRFDLDRATVRTRLEEAGIVPVEARAKEKLFELTPRLEKILDQSNTKLTAAKLQRELANARLAEIKVGEAEGDLAPVGEFTDVVQRLFGGNYKEMVRMIKRWAPRMVKMKNVAEAEKFMLTDYQKFSNSLRSDFEKFLVKK